MSRANLSNKCLAKNSTQFKWAIEPDDLDTFFSQLTVQDIDLVQKQVCHDPIQPLVSYSKVDSTSSDEVKQYPRTVSKKKLKKKGKTNNKNVEPAQSNARQDSVSLPSDPELDPIITDTRQQRTVAVADGSSSSSSPLPIEEKWGPRTPFGFALLQPHSLLTHQIEGIKWIQQREDQSNGMIQGCIYRAEAGLGKTLTSLSNVMRTLPYQTDPTLIVAPKSALYTWINEPKKFFGSSFRVLILHPDISKEQFINISADQIRNYHVVITTYDVVSRHVESYVDLSDFVQGKSVYRREWTHCDIAAKVPNQKGIGLLYHIHWHRIIFDESQVLANCDSKIFKSCMMLASMRRLCLTATPFRNDSTDVYSQLRICGYDEIQSSKDWSMERFESEKLYDYICHCTYQHANVQLPPKDVRVVSLRLTNEENQIYNYFLEQTQRILDHYEDGGVRKANQVIQGITRLRQVCVAPHLVLASSTKSKSKSRKQRKQKDHQDSKENSDNENDNDDDDDIELDGKDAPALTIQDKLEKDLPSQLYQWLENRKGSAGYTAVKVRKIINILNESEPADRFVIYSSFDTALELLAEAINYYLGKKIKCIYLKSRHNIKQRTAILNEWKTSPLVRVLMATYKTASTSLNLTEANKKISMEPWWSPTDDEQADARIYRIGQTRPVTIYNLNIESSVEAKIIECSQRKQKNAQAMYSLSSSSNESPPDSSIFSILASFEHNENIDMISEHDNDDFATEEEHRNMKIKKTKKSKPQTETAETISVLKQILSSSPLPLIATSSIHMDPL